MNVEHRDWRAHHHTDADRWGVARTDAKGRVIYGASQTGDGTPYRCCCEDRAVALADAMNTTGHP